MKLLILSDEEFKQLAYNNASASKKLIQELLNGIDINKNDEVVLTCLKTMLKDYSKTQNTLDKKIHNLQRRYR